MSNPSEETTAVYIHTFSFLLALNLFSPAMVSWRFKVEATRLLCCEGGGREEGGRREEGRVLTLLELSLVIATKLFNKI